MARNGNARTARSTPQKIGQVTNRKNFTVNRHNHEDSGDSSTFLGVVIALVILLIGGAAFMTFQLQRSRAMRAREIEMRLRAREAAVSAVSDPEKKADRHSSPTIMSAGPTRLQSMLI